MVANSLRILERLFKLFLHCHCALFLLLACPFSIVYANVADNISTSLELSELKHESTNNELEIKTALSLSNVAQQSFAYNLSFDYHYDKDIDPYTMNKVVDLEWEVDKLKMIDIIAYSIYY